MNRKLYYGSITATILVILGVMIFELTRGPSYHGALIDPPMVAPAVSLTDQNGKPFELSSLDGKVVLIYFGYTNCPLECPLTMAKLRQVYKNLGTQAADLRVIFITTDPEHDNPVRLAYYLANFDKSFIGLTGEAADLHAAWNAYGVYVGQTDQVHSDLVYAIDRRGRLRLTFPYEMQTLDITQDVQNLLKGD